MEEGYRISGLLSLCFESGHESGKEAAGLINDLSKRFPDQYDRISYTFMDKEGAPPLQAADMLA